jgi:hypothetical protein
MPAFICSSFKLLASGAPAGATQVAKLQEYFGAVPTDYLEIVRQATEIELQHTGGQYIRIWGPMGAIEMDEAYSIRQRLPGALPIGDGGGGHVLFYQEGQQGFGLYHVGYGDLDRGDAIWIAPSLSDFLTKCVGIESF